MKEVCLGFHNGDEDMENSWYQHSVRQPFTEMEFPKFEGGDPRGPDLEGGNYF